MRATELLLINLNLDTEMHTTVNTLAKTRKCKNTGEIILVHDPQRSNGHPRSLTNPNNSHVYKIPLREECKTRCNAPIWPAEPALDQSSQLQSGLPRCLLENLALPQ